MRQYLFKDQLRLYYTTVKALNYAESLAADATLENFITLF